MTTLQHVPLLATTHTLPLTARIPRQLLQLQTDNLATNQTLVCLLTRTEWLQFVNGGLIIPEWSHQRLKKKQ